MQRDSLKSRLSRPNHLSLMPSHSGHSLFPLPCMNFATILADMPRKTRIDAVSALHQIIVRGIERRKIFCDDADRDSFVKRLGRC